MIELENLQEHIKSIKADDWERLFSLLPEIEATKKFGEVIVGERLGNGSLAFPYWRSSEIVGKIFHIFHELDIVPVFDCGLAPYKSDFLIDGLTKVLFLA